MIIFAALGRPNVNLESSFLQVLQEKVVLVDSKGKLWLEIASASLGQLWVFGVMIVKIYCCQEKWRSGICETGDREDYGF